jgi:hypothetical protein
MSDTTQLQLVVSVVELRKHQDEATRAGFRMSGASCAYLVRLGLEVVGIVYRPQVLHAADDRDPDRWLWEGAGEGCSLDHEGLTYDTQMGAVFGLLTQHEKDQHEK